MTVSGIYRATPLRVNPRQRTVKAVYKTYVDVIHFRKADSKRLRERDGEEDAEGWVLTAVRARGALRQLYVIVSLTACAG